MKFLKPCMVLCAAGFLAGCSSMPRQAPGTQQEYYQALKTARHGDLDAAFMYLRAALAASEDSPYHEHILFAIAEYYFLNGAYADAAKAFSQFLERYPDSKTRVFAFVYLMKIAERENRQTLRKQLEREIVTLRQLSLLFRDYQEYVYRSPLNHSLKAVYYIDRVEFYADGDPFAKILY